MVFWDQNMSGDFVYFGPIKCGHNSLVESFLSNQIVVAKKTYLSITKTLVTESQLFGHQMFVILLS